MRLRDKQFDNDYRALVDVVVDVEHLQLALGLALVLVNVRHDLAEAGQRRHQRRVVRVVLVRVLHDVCARGKASNGKLKKKL